MNESKMEGADPGSQGGNDSSGVAEEVHGRQNPRGVRHDPVASARGVSQDGASGV